MEELVECIVKRKLTMGAYIGRCLSIALGLFMVCITLFFSVNYPYFIPVVLLFDVAAGFVIYFVFRNTNVEFEYDFFGGELTIDKIMNKQRRKRVQVFDMNKLEYMAPTDSLRFGNKDNNMEAHHCNYSKCDFEENTYTAYIRNDKNEAVYLEFSPNEELLSLLKKLYPRKVYEE